MFRDKLVNYLTRDDVNILNYVTCRVLFIENQSFRFEASPILAKVIES